MRFELDEYHYRVSDNALIEDLRRVAKELKKNTLTHDEYATIGKFGTNTFLRRFGSWNKSLERAGLNIKNLQDVTNEELFENLEEIWMKLGRQPRYAEIEKPLSRYSLGTYEKRFGGWRKALEKFVEYANSEPKQNEKKAIVSIQKESSKGHKTKRNGSLRLNFLVMRRDKFKCKLCGRSPATNPTIVLHMDHILPWSKGGETIIDNLQTLCSLCNLGKSDLDQA